MVLPLDFRQNCQNAHLPQPSARARGQNPNFFFAACMGTYRNFSSLSLIQPEYNTNKKCRIYLEKMPPPPFSYF